MESGARRLPQAVPDQPAKRLTAADPATVSQGVHPNGRRTAVIVGAGPAGLTAALELLRRTDVVPIVLEATQETGGLSRTVEYKGNRIDIGGHRFFSKSDRVLRWWQQILPLETAADAKHRHDADAVLLLRKRQSRIYFLRKFFPYPLALTGGTLRKLGARRTLAIAGSYLRARLQPIQPQRNLQDFLINRFGRELYRTFFQSYTEKLWGVPCHSISADWGAQRIRGLSLLEAVRDCTRRATRRTPQRSGTANPASPSAELVQDGTEVSLIDRFLYPRLGPGQMWQAVAAEIRARGGRIQHGVSVDRVCVCGEVPGSIAGVEATLADGTRAAFPADYVLSTMPVPALVRALSRPAPAAVREVAEGLLFRDFLTVGVLTDRLALTEADGSLLRDNWIYIQEPGIRMTRLQLFQNWSPGMVAKPETVWLGLEYVCNEQDDLWSMPDADLQRFAIRELEAIGLLRPGTVLDSCVVRAPKAYPAYFGTYDRFDTVRDYLASFANLFPIGRNGMHRYNNQDHSMLTAMTAVDQIASGSVDPEALWSVNSDQSYHESHESPAK